MGSKTVLRIMSFSLALILLGMFAPRLTKGAVDKTSVAFGDVTVGSEATQLLIVSNTNAEPMDVSFYIYGDDCGFSVSYDDPTPGDGTITLLGGGSINVEVKFAPSEPVPCSAALWVVYANIGALSLPISGTGSEAPAVSSTVVIDGYDTGVENRLNDDKPISDHLAICEENAKNHGQYVRCVAFKTRQMRRKKVINGHERRKLLKAAAFANIPPIEAGLEGLEYDGTPVVDLINECKESSKHRKQYRRCFRELIRNMKRAGVTTTKEQRQMMKKYTVRLQFRKEWKD